MNILDKIISEVEKILPEKSKETQIRVSLKMLAYILAKRESEKS